MWLGLLLILSVQAQPCTLSLSGKVYDEYTGSPLAFANILLEETGRGISTDSTGFFLLEDICPGEQHLRITHLGCEPERLFLNLRSDTSLNIRLQHHEEFLEQVTVRTEAPERAAPEISKTLSTEVIDKAAGKSLAELLETVSGVSTLKTGSGIAKPVVHGLYGNRIAVLNNGLVQAGQQWGNDHAPEIDPNAADRITVIKGVAAIEYGGITLGSVVSVEPGPVSSDPHLHGGVNYVFQTNGQGHTLSTRLEQNAPWAAWRLTGTLKTIGDRRAPDYFLTNTGVREANVSARLQRNWSDRWSSSLYYSLFNTEIGILRGAHIGNLTDLQNAIGRETPFFTKDDFSYNINAPRQSVQHHLWKLQTKYLIDDHRFVNLTYGGQLNRRREFDVRRSGRSDIPALSLQLFSHQVQGDYTFIGDRGIRIKAGLQLRYDDNENNPETGILPLIPDYRRYQGGAFVTWRRSRERWTWELGGRYDLTHFQVATITRTVPRSIERFQHTFHNYSLTGGLRWEAATDWVSKFNAGLTRRAPEVNEMHSFGLHQGVAGIEEGDPDLLPEQSLKLIWTNQFTPSDRLLIEATAYTQLVQNYIFLEPQEEFRLTIRGAFPVFLYRQTDATLSGLDLLLKWEPTPRWEWMAKYAMVRGRDRSGELPLVFMPPDNLSTSISHYLPSLGALEEIRLSINGRYVFEQTRLEPEQDFLAPPDAYWLLGLELEARLELHKSDLRFTLQAENLLDQSYRDYLNRLRYYADEMGRNVRVGVRWGF